MQNSRVRLQWIIAAAKHLAKDFVHDEDQRHHLLGPAEESERYLSLDRAGKDLFSDQAEIDTFIATFKGAVTMLFPSECSGADAVRRLTAIVDSEDGSDEEKSKAHRILSILDDGATTDAILRGPASMWWSGRCLDSTCDFAKYLGRNEKTKITVKLTAVGAPAPPREQAFDQKTQAALMAHYYKKEQEAKKLIEDDDISFGNSEWANPKGLKNQLLGMENIKYRPR